MALAGKIVMELILQYLGQRHIGIDGFFNLLGL